MPYFEKLKNLKEDRKMTTKEISEISGVPLATVTRFFRGDSPNAGLDTIAPIALALGASLDEIAGLKQSDAEPIKEPVAVAMDSYAELLSVKNGYIEELKRDMEREREDRLQERKEKRILAMALGAIFVFLLAIFTVDILNGNFGYFRY